MVPLVEIGAFSHRHRGGCRNVCPVGQRNVRQVVWPVLVRNLFLSKPLFFRRPGSFKLIFWLFRLLIVKTRPLILLILMVDGWRVWCALHVSLVHRFHAPRMREGRSSVNRWAERLVIVNHRSSHAFLTAFIFLFLTFALYIYVSVVDSIFDRLLVHLILYAGSHWLLNSSNTVYSLLREHRVLHQIIMHQLFLERGGMGVLRVVNILEVSAIVLWIIVILIGFGGNWEALLVAAGFF